MGLVTNSEAKLLTYINNHDYFLYPFLLNKIEKISELKNDSFYDITNPYGYSGAITNLKSIKLNSEIFAFHSKFVKKNNVIAEFISLFPLIKEAAIPFKHRKKYAKKTCSINLSIQNNSLLKSKHKNMINKALKNGLKPEISENPDDLFLFYKIYISFLKKINSHKKHFLNNNFAKNYTSIIKSKRGFFIKVSNKHSEVISIGLFLISQKNIVYHLSASSDRQNNPGSVNLMLKQALDYGKQFGFSTIFLGGGSTFDNKDNLFSFKSRVADKFHDLNIIEKIHNKKIYSFLEKKYCKKNIKSNNQLIFYR